MAYMLVAQARIWATATPNRVTAVKSVAAAAAHQPANSCATSWYWVTRRRAVPHGESNHKLRAIYKTRRGGEPWVVAARSPDPTLPPPPLTIRLLNSR